MSETVKKARTKRPVSDLVKEIGRNRLMAICSQIVPSQAAMDAILAKESEASELAKDNENETDARVKDFRSRLIASLQREVNAMREKLGNPANVSEFDRQLITRAFKLATKVGGINIVTQATVLQSAKEVFPVVGTKF